MANQMSSFLSKNVYHVIITLSDTILSSSYFTCIHEDLFLNWKEVDMAFGTISENNSIIENSREWFLDKLTQLWSLINICHEKILKSSLETRLQLLPFCSWVDQIRDIERIIREYGSLSENDTLLLVLKLSAGLERSLGDIYSSSGDFVPFLLKDLLASEYLELKLGKTQVRLLQLMIGCVQGLNLRNVSWHGFFSPGELPRKVLAIFVICIASLGKQIKSFDFQKRLFNSCDYFVMHSELLGGFYSDISIDKEIFIKTIKHCRNISSKNWSSWEYSFDLFLSGRLGDCVVFLMPLLENMLRSVFCAANHCPERTLTAESSAYYITLDDVLSQNLFNGKENKLTEVIGSKLFQMLLDLFVYQEGPRLRDKVSHFEIIVEEIPKGIVNYIYGVAISLIVQLSLENIEFDSALKKTLSVFSSVPKSYAPIYHPSAQLVRSMVITVDLVSDWQDLPIPPELKNTDNAADLPLIKWNEYETNDINEVFYQIKTTLKLTSPMTVFRPRSELELINCLRKLISNIADINKNIIMTSTMRYEQWNKREMKSRTRDNYRRMVNCLPVLQRGLAIILSSILSTLKKLYTNDISSMVNILRSYKNYLQFVENVSSMSSVKKNRWNEIQEATLSLIISSEANQ